MLHLYLLELSKLNACVTRLNQITQNNGGCFCVSSGGNGRLTKNSHKHNSKLVKKFSSTLVCNACGQHEAFVCRTWTSQYLTRYTPNTKKRFRLVIVRSFKSGAQPIVAPLYPTKHKCLPKLTESLNLSGDISKERGLPVEKIKTEMRKLAFKIKKDQWSNRTNLASTKIQNTTLKPTIKSSFEYQAKILSKGWTQSNSNNNKVVFESKSLKDLKEKINKKKHQDTPSPLNFPVLAVGKLETDYPPSPYLFVSDSKVNITDNTSSIGEKTDTSSLPSPYFFIKKKFNKEVLTGTHLNPSVIKAETKKHVKTEPSKSDKVSNPYAPSPRLLPGSSKEEFIDDPNVLRRRIDSALKHSLPKKSALDVLGSVQLPKESEKNKKISFPSPNLKEYSRLYQLRDNVPQTVPDTFSLKLLSPNINRKPSTAKIERGKADFSIRFDDYLRSLDKNIRNKTKSIIIEPNNQKEQPKQAVSTNILPLIENPKLKIQNQANQQAILMSNSIETNSVTELNKEVVKTDAAESSKTDTIQFSKVETEQTSDSKIPLATEDVTESEIKTHSQKGKKGSETKPLLKDKPLSNISSVFKKGIHSNSSINAAKKHEDDDDFDKWRPWINDEETKLKKVENYDPDRERLGPRNKWKRLSNDDIIKFNKPDIHDDDQEERLAHSMKRKSMSNADDIQIRKTENYELDRQGQDKQYKWKALYNLDDNDIKSKRAENYEQDYEEKPAPKNRVLHLYSKRTVEVSSPSSYPNEDKYHFVKPLSRKEGDDISDTHVYNHSTPTANQHRNGPNRRRRIPIDYQMDTSASVINDLPQEYNSDPRSHVPKRKADELQQEYTGNYEIRENQDFHNHKNMPQHHMMSSDEGATRMKAHMDENTLDQEPSSYTHVRREEQPNDRLPVHGQSAPYYPFSSRNKHELQEDNENYLPNHQVNHYNVKTTPEVEYTTNDERFREKRNTLSDHHTQDDTKFRRTEKYEHDYEEKPAPKNRILHLFPKRTAERPATDEYSNNKHVWKRDKYDHHEDSMSSDRMQRRVDVYEGDSNLENKKIYHQDGSDEYIFHRNSLENRSSENMSPENDPIFKRQNESLISNEQTKLKEFSDYKNDISVKTLPSSNFLLTNESSIKSEYDPKPIYESYEKKNNLNGEDRETHRNTLQYENSSDLNQSFKKRPSYHSKEFIEDQQSEEQNYHIMNKKNSRQFEGESSNRNVHDTRDKNKVRDSRNLDREMHRKTMQYENRSDINHSLKKRPSYHSKEFIDQRSEEQNDHTSRKIRRQFEGESSHRNVYDSYDKNKVNDSRDLGTVDDNSLIKDKLKRNRDVFLESEIRERQDGQPFEYSLAKESRKSFEDLKELVKNELQVNERKALVTPVSRGGGDTSSNYEGSPKTNNNESDFQRNNIISSRQKVVTPDKHFKDDHNQIRNDQASAESSIMQYHNRKYLNNSYYHLGKAKYSLEKYLQNIGSETDTGTSDNGFSPIQKTSESFQSHDLPKKPQNYEQESQPVRRSKDIERTSDHETYPYNEYPYYSKPDTKAKHDIRSTKIPRDEQNKKIKRHGYQTAEPAMDDEESVQDRRQVHPRKQHWPSIDIKKAVPKLQQKNSEWYNQFKSSKEPPLPRDPFFHLVNPPTEPESSNFESPQTLPDRVPGPYPSPPYPERYYFRKAVPSQPKVKPTPTPRRKKILTGQNKIQEHYKDYYNKPDSTGAIDSIPPYFFNEAYSYGGEEPKYTENYGHFKSLNAAHLAQTTGQGGARRNSHTIVSPSPFFSAPYEHSPGTTSHYGINEESRNTTNVNENYWPGAYEDSMNSYSNRGYQYSQASRDNYYGPADPGRYANQGTYSHSLQNKQVVKNQNYSLGIDQLLRSENNIRRDLNNKMLNSFGNPSRFDQLTESYRPSDSEPSLLFSKVPAILSNSGRGLLEIPRHLSGYFQKLVKWKSLGDYRYRDTDAIMNLNPQINHLNDPLPTDVPVSHENRVEKLSKPLAPLVEHINKNVDNYYIKNSVIDNPMNSVYKANAARQINSNFGYTEEQVTPTMKVSKVSLKLKDKFPFLKKKKLKTVVAENVEKDSAKNAPKDSKKPEVKAKPSQVSKDKDIVKETEETVVQKTKVPSKKRDPVPKEVVSKPVLKNKPKLVSPQEVKTPQPNPLIKNVSVKKKPPSKISKLFKLSKSQEKLTDEYKVKKDAKEVSKTNEPAKKHSKKPNFLAKFINLKPQNKVDVTKLKKPNLNEKKVNDEKVLNLKAKDASDTQSPDTKEDKRDLIDSKGVVLKSDDNKNLKLNEETVAASSIQNQVDQKPDKKPIVTTAISADTAPNLKLEISEVKKQKSNINSDNFVEMPSKKTNSKTLLNVLKHYVTPQKKKNPYKSFSDLY